MRWSPCIDHFQSVTFHLWINHLSFGPKDFLKEIKFLKVDYSILGHEEKGKIPPLTSLLSKFSLRFCFNSRHPLFLESYSMPGTALGMLGIMRISSR